MKKYKFRKITTSPAARCWWCEGKTHYILDNSQEDFFACLKCIKLHIKNPKLKKKIAQAEKAEKLKNSKLLRRNRKKNTHQKNTIPKIDEKRLQHSETPVVAPYIQETLG